MSFEKEKKQDLFAILFYIAVFSVIYAVLVRGEFLFGSTMDFQTQHYLLPEYFRTLFYQTGEIFPDFAPNLGGGENIFYLSYYGLLNPIVLLSYLLPFVKMLDYLIVANCLIVISSAILFYYFLKKHGYSFGVRFVTAFLLLCAAPLIFHAHRHFMFIDYMPFLLMGFFGMDRYFEGKSSFLLVLSSFLMIMTSFYFSVSGLLTLFFYGCYLYKKNRKKGQIKEGLLYGIKIAVPLGIAVLMAAMLLLPTFYALLHGRAVGNGSAITIWNLLKPNTDFSFLLFKTYAPGCTVITLLAIFTMIFSNKRGMVFLSVLSILFVLFPLGNYILNGGLYINAKTLIPMLPLFLLLTAEFLEVAFDKKLKMDTILFAFLLTLPFFRNPYLLISYFAVMVIFAITKVYEKKTVFLIFTVVFTFFLCLGVNLCDTLIPKAEMNNTTYHSEAALVKAVTDTDKDCYRIDNLPSGKLNINRVISANTYLHTIYSSSANQAFSHFAYDILNNEIPFRNRAMLSPTKNPLYHLLMGEKYVFTNNGKEPIGYTAVAQDGDVTAYRNDDAFPIGYASSHLLSESAFAHMRYPDTATSLFSHIVTKNGGAMKVPPIKPTRVLPRIETTEIHNVHIFKEDQGYRIVAKENNYLTIHLNIPMENRILFLRFLHKGNEKEDQIITINDTINKITAKKWKYYNKNSTFDYVLSDTNTLNITFSPGEHILRDFQFFTIDYDTLLSQRQSIDALQIDKEKTMGNHLQGSIDVKEDGFFLLSVPYDKGFAVTVDNTPTPYQKANLAFIGFPITAGHHEISVTYHAPWKKEGICLSIFGFTLWAAVLVVENRKRLSPLLKKKQKK